MKNNPMIIPSDFKNEILKYKPIIWDKVKNFDDLKLVVRGLVADIAFNDLNPMYDLLNNAGLLGDEFEVPSQQSKQENIIQ